MQKRAVNQSSGLNGGKLLNQAAAELANHQLQKQQAREK